VAFLLEIRYLCKYQFIKATNMEEKIKKLTNAQIELINWFDLQMTDEEVKELRQILIQHYSDKITTDIDKLFEKNDWGQEKIEEWRTMPT